MLASVSSASARHSALLSATRRIVSSVRSQTRLRARSCPSVCPAPPSWIACMRASALHRQGTPVRIQPQEQPRLPLHHRRKCGERRRGVHHHLKHGGAPGNMPLRRPGPARICDQKHGAAMQAAPPHAVATLTEVSRTALDFVEAADHVAPIAPRRHAPRARGRRARASY